MTNESPSQQMLFKLKSAFPDAVTEKQRMDDDGNPCYVYALKQEFIQQLEGESIDFADDQNRYELQFPGKQMAKAAAFTPCYKTLIADKQQSKNFDTTENVFIEGDNLDALQMLQKSYRGKVKVIYIDPPYNTGSDDFVYNDDFSVAQKKYLQTAGILDEDGVRQISEIQNGLRGRFHAGWLASMYPRLKLARGLLSDDGVIFISIDDNEQANLKLLCDEIFGEENFVANIIWHRKDNASFLSKKIVNLKEYILFYQKSDAFKETLDKEIDPERARELINISNNVGNRILPKNAVRFENGESNKTVEKGSYGSKQFHIQVLKSFRLTNGMSDRDVEVRGRFSWSQEKINSEISNGGRIEIKTIKSFKPAFYRMQTGEISKRPLIDIFSKKIDDRVKTTHDATKNLKEIFGNNAARIFEYSKPYGLMKMLIGAISNNDIILDFFAGSATTAHAVIQLNAEDGGNRKFILVQLPEKIDPKKSKETHDFCTQALKRPATIAEIAKERIRRAGDKIRTENPDWQGDIGFRAFVIQDSMLNDGKEQPLASTGQSELNVYKTELKRENFEPLLYEALLWTGVTLELPLWVDEIDNYPFAICDRRCYCVTENLTQKIVADIAKKHGDDFDTFYYLSDALHAKSSFTEIEAVILQAPGNKQIQGLTFY